MFKAVIEVAWQGSKVHAKKLKSEIRSSTYSKPHTIHVTRREVEETASTLTLVGASGAGEWGEGETGEVRMMESMDTQDNHSLLGCVHS